MDSFVGIQAVFAYCVIIGGILFVFRLVIALMGMGNDFDAHSDIDHSGGMTHDHADSDASFKLLSFQGLMAFFLTFGIFGLGASKSSKLSDGISCLIATTAGLGTVFLLNKLFRMFARLQHAGNLNFDNAVGKTGTVYLTIKPGEGGKVTVSIQGRLVTMDALAFHPLETINTGRVVQVQSIVNGNTLVVTAVPAE